MSTLKPFLPGTSALFAILLGCAGCASYPTFTALAPIARTPSAITNPSALSPSELELEIAAKRKKVVEFEFLREWGEKNGVRIWIAGGSAAGFAHYVKADAERLELDRLGRPQKYMKSRFRYGYYQIYRSTQDADVVIDANEEQAVRLESELASRFNYLQGSKSAWEVRLLRQPRGEGAGLKEPLIDNPNFRNQHSDSHSTGMIELTEKKGEPVVRDLFDWYAKDAPQFLRDVAEGRLHFYYSPLHAQTLRAMNGLNPPILSVIRYYTKAFQYGLEARREDLPVVQQIIDAFDPKDPALAKAKGTLESNARKLYSHAENLENAYLTLRENGLLAKLISAGDAGSYGSMGTWLSRVPLLTHPLSVGPGAGRTAREIFDENEITVSHETSDILAYESITRSKRGLPNVFISRDNAVGETASYGDGFYTRAGREGAAGTGLTIRFRLAPEAREHVDFIFIKEHNYVVVLNRAAISVIDESLELDPVSYFRFLASQKYEASDYGLWRMLGTQLQSDFAELSASQKRKAITIVDKALARGGPTRWVLEFAYPLAVFQNELPRWSEHIFSKSKRDEFLEARQKVTKSIRDFHEKREQQLAIDFFDLPPTAYSPSLRESWIEHFVTSANMGTQMEAIRAYTGYRGKGWKEAEPELLDRALRSAHLWVIEQMVADAFKVPDLYTPPSRMSWILGQLAEAKAKSRVGYIERRAEEKIRTFLEETPIAHAEWLETGIRMKLGDVALESILKNPTWTQSAELKAACGKDEVTLAALKRFFFEEGGTFKKSEATDCPALFMKATP